MFNRASIYVGAGKMFSPLIILSPQIKKTYQKVSISYLMTVIIIPQKTGIPMIVIQNFKIKFLLPDINPLF